MYGYSSYDNYFGLNQPLPIITTPGMVGPYPRTSDPIPGINAPKEEKHEVGKTLACLVGAAAALVLVIKGKGKISKVFEKLSGKGANKTAEKAASKAEKTGFFKSIKNIFVKNETKTADKAVKDTEKTSLWQRFKNIFVKDKNEVKASTNKKMSADGDSLEIKTPVNETKASNEPIEDATTSNVKKKIEEPVDELSTSAEKNKNIEPEIKQKATVQNNTEENAQTLKEVPSDKLADSSQGMMNSDVDTQPVIVNVDGKQKVIKPFVGKKIDPIEIDPSTSLGNKMSAEDLVNYVTQDNQQGILSKTEIENIANAKNSAQNDISQIGKEASETVHPASYYEAKDGMLSQAEIDALLNGGNK